MSLCEEELPVDNDRVVGLGEAEQRLKQERALLEIFGFGIAGLLLEGLGVSEAGGMLTW